MEKLRRYDKKCEQEKNLRYNESVGAERNGKASQAFRMTGRKKGKGVAEES